MLARSRNIGAFAKFSRLARAQVFFVQISMQHDAKTAQWAKLQTFDVIDVRVPLDADVEMQNRKQSSSCGEASRSGTASSTSWTRSQLVAMHARTLVLGSAPNIKGAWPRFSESQFQDYRVQLVGSSASGNQEIACRVLVAKIKASPEEETALQQSGVSSGAARLTVELQDHSDQLLAQITEAAQQKRLGVKVHTRDESPQAPVCLRLQRRGAIELDTLAVPLPPRFSSFNMDDLLFCRPEHSW